MPSSKAAGGIFVAVPWEFVENPLGRSLTVAAHTRNAERDGAEQRLRFFNKLLVGACHVDRGGLYPGDPILRYGHSVASVGGNCFHGVLNGVD
jgi:hypothetical protein